MSAVAALGIVHAMPLIYMEGHTHSFKRAIVLTPSKVVLEHFHERIKPIYKLISALTKGTKALTEARNLLLPRLMNGEVAV